MEQGYSETGSNTPRHGRGLVALLFVSVIFGCGWLGYAPYRSSAEHSGSVSAEQMKSAYDAIQPGITRFSDLAAIGLDTASSATAKTLSYLDIVDRMVPHNSFAFDALAPAAKSCIDAREHCTVLLFKPDSTSKNNSKIAFFVQDGLVVYKLIWKGRDDDRHSVHPAPAAPLPGVAQDRMRIAAREAAR